MIGSSLSSFSFFFFSSTSCFNYFKSFFSSSFFDTFSSSKSFFTSRASLSISIFFSNDWFLDLSVSAASLSFFSSFSLSIALSFSSTSFSFFSAAFLSCYSSCFLSFIRSSRSLSSASLDFFAFIFSSTSLSISRLITAFLTSLTSSALALLFGGTVILVTWYSTCLSSCFFSSFLCSYFLGNSALNDASFLACYSGLPGSSCFFGWSWCFLWGGFSSEPNVNTSRKSHRIVPTNFCLPCAWIWFRRIFYCLSLSVYVNWSRSWIKFYSSFKFFMSFWNLFIWIAFTIEALSWSTSAIIISN